MTHSTQGPNRDARRNFDKSKNRNSSIFGGKQRENAALPPLGEILREFSAVDILRRSTDILSAAAGQRSDRPQTERGNRVSERLSVCYTAGRRLMLESRNVVPSRHARCNRSDLPLDGEEPIMTPTDKTLVTVATYNEMENLPRLVEEIFRYAPQVDILVIDDNSPDGTGRWCDRQRADEPAHRLPAPLGQAGPGHGHDRRHEIRHRTRLSLRAEHGRRFQPSAEVSAGAAGRHGSARRAAGRRDDRLALRSPAAASRAGR